MKKLCSQYSSKDSFRRGTVVGDIGVSGEVGGGNPYYTICVSESLD